MNCKLHPTREAVATCEKCGCGICSECAAITASTGNYCVKCAYDETVQDINFDVSVKKTLKRNIKLLLITWIIGGLMTIIGAILVGVYQSKGDLTGDGGEIGVLLLIAGICISGIFSAIDGWKYGAKIQNRYEDMFGESYNVSGGYVTKDTGLGVKLISAFYGLLFGLVASPTKIFKYKQFVKEIDDELREISPIKTQLAHFYNSQRKA